MRDGQYFLIDDLTRQDCIDMLERIGAASVPELIRTIKRKDVGEKGRRLAALALGGTKDPRAYEPLVERLRKDPSWQVRADAATALAKLGDGRAVRPLTDAIQKDKVEEVVRRAGKARYELLKSGARR
jgi:HEAT repeat protein